MGPSSLSGALPGLPMRMLCADISGEVLSPSSSHLDRLVLVGSHFDSLARLCAQGDTRGHVKEDLSLMLTREW
jgi:hypothetical protein